MYPADIPEYNGSMSANNAYLLVLEPEYDSTGCENWTTRKLSMSDMTMADKNNVATLDKVGTNFAVPTGGVVGAYVNHNGVPELASKDGHEAQFLIIGTNFIDNQSYMIATAGVVRLPDDRHEYLVGRTYYLGSNGVPTTEQTKQKLFNVLDKQRIIVY